MNASPVSLIHQTYSVIQNPAEGIKQLASSDISTMRSSLIVTCRPDKVWTAPIPGGALTRSATFPATASRQ